MKYFNQLRLNYKKTFLVETQEFPSLKKEDVNLFDLELNQFGFSLSLELKDQLEYAKNPKEAYDQILDYCISSKGANKKYDPLFKDFPETKYDTEDYKIQLLHYLESFYDLDEAKLKSILPEEISDYIFNDEYKERVNHKRIYEALDEECRMIELDSSNNPKDVENIFKDLLSTNLSLKEYDLDVIKNLIVEHDFKHHIPEEIPFKENMVTVAKSLLESNVPVKTVSSLMKTPTDVLRYVASISGGDASLTNKVIFRLKRKERKRIMEFLNNTNLNDEDFLRHRETFIHLFQVLHTGEYTNKYPELINKVQKLRNNPKSLYSFNRELEKAYSEKNENKILDLLRKRKGLFFRHIMRLSKVVEKETLLKEIPSVLKDVKTSNLYTLRKLVNSDLQERFFVLKNGTVWNEKENPSRDFSFNKELNILIDNELKERFSSMERLGKVYINPELKNKLAPLNQRFSSKSLLDMPKGSRRKLDDTKDYLRFFVYWKNNNQRVDLDLSASGLNEDFEQVLDISYYNLTDLDGKHSGDITDAPDGASEFIDLPKSKLLEKGVRYLLLNVYSFTGQTFNTFEARAGFMERKNPFKGKTFEAKTVSDVFELNNPIAKNATMLVFDLKENEVIFVDLSGKYNHVNADNMTRNKANLMYSLNALQIKPNVYDVLRDHVESRGELVKDKKDAETIIEDISNEDFLANYIK